MKHKDVNEQLQEWQAKKVSPEIQRERVQRWLTIAEPYLLVWANEIGDIQNIAEKTEAMNEFFAKGVATLDPNDRAGYQNAVIERLGIKSNEFTQRVRALNGHVKKSTAKGEEDEPVRTAGGWIQHHLVELFFDREKMRMMLAVKYPDGTVSDLKDQVNIEGTTYKPIFPTSSVTKKIVLLPSELGEPMSEDELLAATNSHINKYFDFGSDLFFQEIAPLYVPFTYLYDAFTEVSYLRGMGDYGTGKTRFIKTIGRICYRPIYMSGGSSAASIYHLLDFYRGTLVLNEGDFGQSDEASIIAKILNGGTEKDEAVTKLRKDASGNFEPEAFNVFGPKVIATRKEFDDRAIRSRCLTMEMVPFQPHPRIPLSSPPEKELDELEIRNLWTTYRMHHAKESITVDESLADRSVEPRLNQITLSLLSTINDDKTRERIQAFIRAHNERTKEERYQAKTARVVEGLVIANAWGAVSDHPSDQERVYLKDVTKAANMRIDEMKAAMGEEEEEESEGRGKKFASKMTSRGVSSVLEKFCQIQTRRTSDGVEGYRGTTEIVWDEARIKALCERWGVAWKERGSEERPKETVVKFGGPGSASKKLRDEWNSMEFEGGS